MFCILLSATHLTFDFVKILLHFRIFCSEICIGNLSYPKLPVAVSSDSVKAYLADGALVAVVAPLNNAIISKLPMSSFKFSDH